MPFIVPYLPAIIGAGATLGATELAKSGGSGGPLDFLFNDPTVRKQILSDVPAMLALQRTQAERNDPLQAAITALARNLLPTSGGGRSLVGGGPPLVTTEPVTSPIRFDPQGTGGWAGHPGVTPPPDGGTGGWFGHPSSTTSFATRPPSLAELIAMLPGAVSGPVQ